MIKKIILALVCLMLLLLPLKVYAGERIVYAISPIGKAEYSDLGIVDLNGKKARLVIFKTRILGFDDTERIYSEIDSQLPIRVEREVAWFGRENIVEEYNQKDFTVTLTKFKKGKLVSQQIIKGDGPIYNAILVPFYPRSRSDLSIGWSFVFRLPQKFQAKLDSIDEIVVAGKKFSAYHFVSIPDKFEVWISNDSQRIPIKIKGRGGFNYSLVMKEHSASN